MRILAGAIILAGVISAGNAAECGGDRTCPPPTATRGDILYYPDRDFRLPEPIDYGDSDNLEECSFQDGKLGLRVSSETCMRLGGMISLSYEHSEMRWKPFGEIIYHKNAEQRGRIDIFVDNYSDTEFGVLRGYFRNIVYTNYYQYYFLQNEIYIEIDNFLFGYTSSLWESSSPSDISKYSTFSWAGINAGRDNLRNVLAYRGRWGSLTYGISVESVDNYMGGIDPSFVVAVSKATPWGGAWGKVASDTHYDSLAVKAGFHWQVDQSRGRFRLIASRIERPSYYVAHYFGFPGDLTEWGLIAAYERSLTERFSISGSLGLFATKRELAVETELGISWRSAHESEFRFDATFYNSPQSEAMALYSSLRFTRSF